MPVAPIVEVKNLSFSYAENRVLEDISFEIHPGDYVGIIGPNGGGKTTLLKILLGLLKPTEGSIKIFGHEPTSRIPQGSMGYVPQRVSSTHGFFPATVEEVIQTGRISKMRWGRRFSAHDEKMVEEVMSILDITELKGRLMHELSGGQRQRVFMARALARKPKLLILDEPTVGVDLQAQEDFYQFLKKINREEGIGILSVSHDIDVVSRQVGYVLCLNGRMICHTSTKDFIEKDFLKKLYGEHAKFIVHH